MLWLIRNKKATDNVLPCYHLSDISVCEGIIWSKGEEHNKAEVSAERSTFIHTAA